MTFDARHADRDHAIYAPSAAHRWMICRGSIAASVGIPNRESEAAREGTECHEAGSKILLGMNFGDAVDGLSDEQIDIVEKYVDYAYYMLDAMRERYGRAEWKVEERVRAASIHPDYHGTADLTIIGGNLMRVIDLKGGWWPVTVRYSDTAFNVQLLSYLLLSLVTLGARISPWEFDLRPTGIERVKLTIVQPRVYDDAVTVDVPLDVLERFKDDVIEAIEDIEGGNTKRVAGEHCKFCPAAGQCPVLRDRAIKSAKMDFGVYQSNVRNYTPEQLAEIKNEAELIQAHLDGVNTHVYNQMMAGRNFPGWKLIPRRALKKWKDPNEARRVAIKKGLTGEKLYTSKLITPTQMIKLAKQNGIDYDFKNYWEANSSGLKMVPDSDPHEGVKVRPGDDFTD